MTEHSENYKGRTIVVRSAGAGAAATARSAAPEAELYVDGKPITVVRNSSGEYIASGLAYSPQRSPVELAKQLIDYAEKVK